MGIPHKTTTDGHPAITRLQYDYFLQEFEAGMMPGETNFSFETDEENELCSFGYSKEAEQPYWIRENKQTDEKRFTSSALLFSSPLFYGKSLRERWDEVVIYSIASQSLNDWLSYADHSVETLVSEPEDDCSLYINGVELDGFINEEGKSCPTCGRNTCYLEDYDDYCCPYCRRMNGGMMTSWITLKNVLLSQNSCGNQIKYCGFVRFNF
ncbi:TPA: hypothetical protein UDO34_002174 [Streptococcus suis]|nr:hypothetical protein [Streptococcus suis]